MDLVKALSVNMFNIRLASLLKGIYKKENLSSENIDPVSIFISLATKLQVRFGSKVAVLIDEYDTPITHNIYEPGLAQATLKALKEFYGVLKGDSEHIGLIFMTGVTKFARPPSFPSSTISRI
jgi:hypothetical protein